MKEPVFRKSLARYYEKWFFDCHDSIIFCRERGREEDAKKYARDASRYLTIIMENLEAIDFFKRSDRAFLRDEALPTKFRGYANDHQRID